MEKNVKHIIREVAPECTNISYMFDELPDLYIVCNTRNCNGFEEKEYKSIVSEIEELCWLYEDIRKNVEHRDFSSVGEMLCNYDLIKSVKNTAGIRKFKQFFEDCLKKPSSPYGSSYNQFEAHTEDFVAKYLTSKTGEKWNVIEAYGYSQGDVVSVVYSEKIYTEKGAKSYGEMWLGAYTEFYVIDLDEDGEEADSCGGYVVADCQAWKDEDYKKIVCEWACIKESETRIEMIDESHTYTKYSYRAA